MKRKLFKTTLALLAVFSLFLLFSCGKGDDDKLKADAFEQFNESIKDVAGVFSAEIADAPEIELDSLLNYDFSLDNVYVDEFLGYEIDSITVKDGMMFLQGLDAPGLVKPKNFAAKIYESEMVIFELLGSSVRETVVPFNVDMPEVDIDSVKGIGDIFDALLIDKDDLKETVTEGKFKLEDGYLEELAKSLGGFGLEELIEAIEITVDASDYESENKIVFTILVGAEEMRMIVSFGKADGVDTVTILLDEENSDESTELALKTKDGKFVGFAMDAGDSEEYINFELNLQEQKSDVKGLKKQSLTLKLLTVDLESEIYIEASGDVYQNKNGALAKLDINMSVKEDEKELLSASLLYDESCLKKEGKEGISISLMLRDIDLDDIKDGITAISAKPTVNKGENSLELRLETEKYTDSEKRYKLSIELSGESGEKTGGAWINFPAKTIPELTEKEREVIERRDNLGANGTAIAKKAAELNQQAIVAISRGAFQPQEHFYKVYTYHRATNAYYFTDVTLVDGQYYVTTRALADYESYLPMYAKNLYNFAMFEKSAVAKELEEIIGATDTQFDRDLYQHRSHSFFSYVYFEEYDCYAVMSKTSIDTATFTTEKPEPERFPGSVLHEIRKDQNGYTAHDFSLLIEAGCHLRYTCEDCGEQYFSKRPMHQYEDQIEPKPGLSNGEYEFYSCTNCDEMVLKLFDENGVPITVNISKAQQYEWESLRLEPALLDYNFSDFDKNLFISGISYDGLVLPGTINIPKIDEIYDYKIVGALSRFAYVHNFAGAEIILPEGVEFLLVNAFTECRVDKIVLPDSLIYIGDYAFRNCAVKELTIPKNVKLIGDSAFENLYNLETLVVNSEVLESLPPIYAAELSTFEINSTVKEFGGFSGCWIEEFVIPDGVEIIGIGFQENDTIKKITFASSVKEIYSEAFSGCISLETVILNKNLTKIPDFAFMGCRSLTEITFGEGLTEIGISAFEHCKSLKSVVLPSTLEVVCERAFESCYALENVEFLSVSVIGDGAFGACTALKEIKLPENLEKIGASVFQSCTALESAVIPKSLTVISMALFNGCTSLKTVELHDGVTEIHHFAFNHCSMLESLGDVSAVKLIGREAFSGCAALTDEAFGFGDALEGIGAQAFIGCYGLKNIVIPGNVTRLADDAFYACTFDTVRFDCPYGFGELSHVAIGEATYTNEIRTKITFGKVTNIYTTELPEVSGGVTYKVPATAEKINFAGSELEFALAGYVLESGKTVANYEVTFENKEE